MTGPAIAFMLVLWVSLLYVPFRWRPLGIYLFSVKVLAAAYVPWIVVVGAALAVVGAESGSWWTVVPAGMAALGALVVVVRTGSVRADLSGALGVSATSTWRAPSP